MSKAVVTLVMKSNEWGSCVVGEAATREHCDDERRRQRIERSWFTAEVNLGTIVGWSYCVERPN
jgi:hypothetical protein